MNARRPISVPDIRFQDEKMNRLVQHLSVLTQEVQRLQQALKGGKAGQRLTKRTGDDYDAEWV